MTGCEQCSRNPNPEIKGAPGNGGDNLTEIVFFLGELIGEQILPAHIENCHRVPTRSDGKSNVVVQFQHRIKRDNGLERRSPVR